jgi:predicted ATPase
LPLAIELAAPGVKMLSPAALLARLANLLAPPQQKLFRRMSVFAGGCTLEAAEAVCAAYGDLGINVFEGLASLVDKSLVQQVPSREGEDRFAMLETIRAHAAEQLLLNGEQPATARAHAAYFLVRAEDGHKELVAAA